MGKVWLSNSAALCRALTFDSRLARVFHRILADHRNGQRHCRFLAQVRASVGGGRYASRQFPHHRIGVQFHLHRPRVHERCGDGCCLFTCCDTRAIDHELSGKRRHPLPSGMGKDRRSGRSRVADAPRHQIRMYPTPEQAEFLNRQFGAVRFVLRALTAARLTRS